MWCASNKKKTQDLFSCDVAHFGFDLRWEVSTLQHVCQIVIFLDQITTICAAQLVSRLIFALLMV